MGKPVIEQVIFRVRIEGVPIQILFDDLRDLIVIRVNYQMTTVEVPNPKRDRGGRRYKPCATHVDRLLASQVKPADLEIATPVQRSSAASDATFSDCEGT